MRKAYSLTENATQNLLETPENVLESLAFKDFFVFLLKGISIYAHRAGKASFTDAAVNRFVAEALGILAGDNPVDIDEYQQLAVQALKMRKTAADLYERACNENKIQRENLLGPATIEFFTDKQTLAAQARGLSAKKLSMDQKDYYWELVCIDQLSTIGSIVASAEKSITNEYDVYGFLHKGLDYLSRNLSSVELVALADQLENARTKIVNSILAGDTLVDISMQRITLSDIKKP